MNQRSIAFWGRSGWTGLAIAMAIAGAATAKPLDDTQKGHFLVGADITNGARVGGPGVEVDAIGAKGIELYFRSALIVTGNSLNSACILCFNGSIPIRGPVALYLGADLVETEVVVGGATDSSSQMVGVVGATYRVQGPRWAVRPFADVGYGSSLSDNGGGKGPRAEVGVRGYFQLVSHIIAYGLVTANTGSKSANGSDSKSYSGATFALGLALDFGSP